MIENKEYYQDYAKTFGVIRNLDMLKNSKVLITGATGLIGSALVDFLVVLNDERNANITIFVGARNLEKARKRFGQALERKDVKYFQYDAEKPIESEESFDYIIHAASPATPAWYSEKPVETMKAILEGTTNVLEYAKTHSVRRALYISSSEVYGQINEKRAYTEDDCGYVDILNPRACYPSAKRSVETLCSAYAKEYGVDVVIVRPGHVYGPTAQPEDVRASSAFLYDAASGRDIVMKSAGMQLRSYCYVADCASSIFAVLCSGEKGQAYNISNKGSVVTIRDFANAVAKASGKEIVFENPSDKELAGYNLMSNSSLDSMKIENLGWKGMFTLTEGVHRSIEVLKEQLTGGNK